MSLATLVQSLEEYAESCEAEYQAAMASGDVTPEAQAVVAIALRNCTDDLNALKKRIFADVLAETGYTTLQVPEVGPIPVKQNKWFVEVDHDSLIRHVVARLADEPGSFFDEDGTMLPIAEVAARIAQGLRECVSFGAPKVTGLGKRGMDVDEYAKTKREPYMQLPKRAIA